MHPVKNQLWVVAGLLWTLCAIGGADNLVFIHHSVGENWLNHSLNAALLAKDYIDERNDITYGTVVSPDAGRPDSLAPVPGDLTDMNYWILWFNDYLENVKTHDCAHGVNRIIMFKSCFPNSNIWDDGEEPGDPFSGDFTLTNFRAVYRHPDGPGNTYSYNEETYRALDDVFADNPDTLFIIVTSPPMHYAPDDPSDSDAAARAREFTGWLRGEWLTDYNNAHSDLNNVAVFDLFDLLAYPAGIANLHRNRLREEYGGESGDSHPNDAANALLTQVFASSSPSFLDDAWERFGWTSEGEGEGEGAQEGEGEGAQEGEGEGAQEGEGEGAQEGEGEGAQEGEGEGTQEGEGEGAQEGEGEGEPLRPMCGGGR